VSENRPILEACYLRGSSSGGGDLLVITSFQLLVLVRCCQSGPQEKERPDCSKRHDQHHEKEGGLQRKVDADALDSIVLKRNICCCCCRQKRKSGKLEAYFELFIRKSKHLHTIVRPSGDLYGCTLRLLRLQYLSSKVSAQFEDYAYAV